MAVAKRTVVGRGGTANGDDVLSIPNLVEIQLDSYGWFCEEGLRQLFDNFSPIEDYTGTLSLEFLDYQIGEPTHGLEECRERDLTYEAPLKAKVRLVNKETGEIKESEVYMGELPAMTEKGTFLINGAERVVISQLARSPGVYFKDSIDFSGQILYSAQVIPSEGSWIEFDTDASGVISVKIHQTRKFPITTLLRALDHFDEGVQTDLPRTGATEEILQLFGEAETLTKPDAGDLLGSWTTGPIADPRTREHIVGAWELIADEDVAKAIAALKRVRLRMLRVPREITATLEHDPTSTAEEGLLDIYRKMRPGDPPTVESAESLLYAQFFDVKRYDLARVGRHKVNRKLGLEVPEEVRTLTRADVIAIVQYLVRLSAGEGTVDDIDHLQNKRIRAVGELLQTQLRIGFLRMERVARERMTSLEPEKLTAQAIISIKPITAAVKSFFGSGQLSQFMDQINPLAELAHKRRLSALGPGGLSKQSAKLEVRDVHHSHYGRICPIETPEGPNVGLIGYLTLHAKVDEYGFIQTPYRKVVKGRVTDEVEYLTADEEQNCSIAPASAPVDENGRFVAERVTVRRQQAFPAVPATEIDYMDVSPKQVFSVATSLIPFLENDEPVRGLAGSNMQRQAVPLLVAEQPIVKAGMERRAAVDSGAVLLAESDGIVTKATAREIVTQRPDGTEQRHRLQNFVRTNMGTCVNQKRLVRHGDRVVAGQTIADGPCTADGELALGRNLLVAFIPWEGYNYEDAMVIGERLVQEDILTSIHIEKFECEARDTKLGPEEITRDIPNVGEDALRDLDENGVVRIGAEVRAEDILVGKVAPKGQSELTAEEKLVIAIFGKKAEEMRDVSLPVPHGEKGIVVATKVFSRYKYTCETCGAEYQLGKPLDREECERCMGTLRREPGDELLPGVNQRVQVYVAEKRKIMVGDKLTGRHGNKGVIAKIVPGEDMPHLADGTPVDICLNPLTVPSRMNIGQILETHLGYVGHELGRTYVSPIFEGVTEAEITEGLEEVYDQQRREAIARYANQQVNRFEPLVQVSADGEAEPLEQLAEQLAGCEAAQLDHLAEWFGVDVKAWEQASRAERPRIIAGQVERNAMQRVRLVPATGKMTIYDGRTGEPFNQDVAVGHMYIMKLLHLVEDKIHARSTGPYSLVTQQPLGGKAQFGGQRFGEMEVWALEAYGAAYTLQEILTIKSDDVLGRVKTYESIVKGENIQEPGVPESFKILIKELQSLGLRVTVETDEGVAVELRDPDEEGAE